MVNVRLCQTHSLDDDLINLSLNLSRSEQAVVLLNLLEDELVRALATDIISILVTILHKAA